jgi:hypothetical protein
MSIDLGGDSWGIFQKGLEQAVRESKNVGDLNTRIQTLFKTILPLKKISELRVIGILNSQVDKTNLPLSSTIMTNLIDQQIKPLEWDGLERKFALLQKTYPTEFAEVIKEIKEESYLPLSTTNFKEIFFGLLKGAVKKDQPSIKDIFNEFGTFDFNELETHFMGLIYKPLRKLRSQKFTGQKKIGLRNKPLEIQEMFSLGKKNQIASIKNQFKEKKTFDQIFKDTCLWRSNLALLCLENTVVVEKFGRVRTTESPLVSGFKACKAPEELIKKCEHLTKENQDKITKNNAFPSNQKFLSQKTIYGNIEKRQIPLTTLNHFTGNPENLDQKDKDLYPGLHFTHSWTHTGGEQIPECLKHIEDLYQQLLKAKYPDQRLQLIARIHWWGCHACPCERGSAAIMEAICQGLLEGSNLPFKLNPEKPVDIYALTEPDENQFVKDYVSLLQSTELD